MNEEQEIASAIEIAKRLELDRKLAEAKAMEERVWQDMKKRDLQESVWDKLLKAEIKKKKEHVIKYTFNDKTYKIPDKILKENLPNKKSFVLKDLEEKIGVRNMRKLKKYLQSYVKGSDYKADECTVIPY